jgi:hypothetical protein
VVIALVAVALLIGLPVVYLTDKSKTDEILANAKIVRTLAELAMPHGVDSFSDRPSHEPMTDAAENLITESLRAASAPLPLPVLFGSRSRAKDLSILAAAYAQLAIERRATWLARSKLEAAVTAVEQTAPRGSNQRSHDLALQAMKDLGSKLHAIDIAELEKKAAIEAAETAREAARSGISPSALDPDRSPSRDEPYPTRPPVRAAEPVRVERPTAVPEPFGHSTRPTPAVGGAFKKAS